LIDARLSWGAISQRLLACTSRRYIQEDEDLKRRIDRRIVAIVYFLGLSALFTSLLGNAPFPGLKWIGIVAVLLPALESAFGAMERRTKGSS